MNNKLRNIINIFVLAVFLFTSVGYSINIHYCKKTGSASSAIFGNPVCTHSHERQSSCCPVEEEQECNCVGHCATESVHSETLSCCINKTEFFHLTDNYLTPEQSKEIQPEINELVVFYEPSLINREETKFLNTETSIVYPDSPRKRIISYICKISSLSSDKASEA